MFQRLYLDSRFLEVKRVGATTLLVSYEDRLGHTSIIAVILTETLLPSFCLTTSVLVSSPSYTASVSSSSQVQVLKHTVLL